MAERKRRRCGDDLSGIRKLLHKGGITITGLKELLDKVRETDLEHSSMHLLREANAEQFLSVRRIIRLPLTAGGTWDWELADPNRLLQLAVNASPTLQHLFAAAVRRSPPSCRKPWHLVIGFDEFMPGLGVQ
jgi:hypothetical protein